MRLFASVAAVATLAASLFVAEPRAQAQDYLAAPPTPAVFVYHGRRYCFAPEGWHGPGWYWCGYAHRPGFGWGGPVGWLGWRVPWHGGGWNPRWGHGPVVYPPYGGGWRGPGWQSRGWGWAGWHPHRPPHWGGPRPHWGGPRPHWGGPHGWHPPRGPGWHRGGGAPHWHGGGGGRPWHPHVGHGGHGGPHRRH